MRAAVAIIGLLLLGGCMADTQAPEQPTMYLSMANGGALTEQHQPGQREQQRCGEAGHGESQ